MAFVFERVPETNWELFNSFDLSFDGKKLIASKYKWWTVGREREIYLILLGGGAFEIPEDYILIWNNNKIRISICDKKCVTNDSSEKVLHFRIENIIAPISLIQCCNDLIAIIKESFACYVDCNFVIDFFAEPKFVV